MEFDATALSDSSGGGGEGACGGPDADLLLLIYKYVKAKPGFSRTLDALQKDLDESESLGTRFSWDGKMDRATIADYDRKYEYLDDSHLSTVAREIESYKRRSLLEKFPSKLNYNTEACRLINLQREFHTIERSIKQFEEYIASDYKNRNIAKKMLQNSHNDIMNVDEDDIPGNFTTTDGDRALNQDSDELQLIDRRVNLNIKSVEGKRKELKVKAAVIEASKKELSKLSILPSQKVKSAHDFILDRQCGLTSMSNRYIPQSRFGFAEQTLFTSHMTLQIMTSYKHLYTISGHSGNITNNDGFFNAAYCVAFDHTNKYVITGADDCLVKVWDLHEGLLMYSCRGHSGEIVKLLVTPDNSLIISACVEGYIRFWRLCNGQCIKVLRHGQFAVLDIQFNLFTMSFISVGSEDGKCKVWNLPEVFAGMDVSPTGYDVPLIDVYNRDHSSNSGRNILNSLEGASSDLYEPISLDHQRRGKPVMIKNMDVSPCGNYLVTGGEDGVARLWKFGKNPVTGEGFDSYRPNRSRNSQSQDDDDAESPRSKDPNLIMSLEGHVSTITDLKFSNSGDRILSGSGDDGQVRIWAFKADFSASSNIVLEYMNDVVTDGEQPASTQLQVPRRGSMSAKKPFQTQLYSLAWTFDDRRIVTINSFPNPNAASVGKTTNPAYSRMKVWNSFNGDLLRVIPIVNTGISEQLAPHPFNPAIVATGDYNGNIVVWDTEKEKAVFAHQLKTAIDDTAACRITDLSFNSEGTMLAMTDYYGRFSIIGLDNPERYKNVISDQYFSSDYAEFDYDLDGIAIDRGSQLPVHQSPKGVLCQIDGSAHALQPQPFKPSGSLLHIDEDSINEMISSNRESFKTYADAVERSFEIFSRYQKHKKKGKIANKWTWFDEPKGASADRSKSYGTAGSPFKAFQSASSSSSSSSSSSAPFHVIRGRNTSNSNSRDNIRSNSSNTVDLLDDGFDVDDTNNSDADGNYSNSDDEDEGRRRSSRLSRDKGHNRRHISNRSGLRSSKSSHMANSSDEGNSSDTSNEYQSDSDEEVRRRQRGAAKRRGRKPGRRPNTDDDDDDEEEGGGMDLSSTKKIKMKRTIDYSRMGGFDNLNGKPILPIGCEIDRKWLQSTTVQSTRYCPQVGDRIVYICEGHKRYLIRFPLYDGQGAPPWNSFDQKYPLVMCQVTSISYSFPNASEYNACHSVIAVVKLALVAVPQRCGFDPDDEGRFKVNFQPWPLQPQKNTRQTLKKSPNFIFEVVLRSCESPDFLVPEHLFTRCVDPMRWAPGLHVVVKYIETIGDGMDEDEKDYLGIVQSFEPCDQNNQLSPWDAINIKWYNGAEDEIGQVSPWEAVPKEEHNIYERGLEKYPAPAIEESTRVAIIDAITRITTPEVDLFGSFQTEEGYPEDYYCIVEVPMTIGLIKNRLASNYYRQVASVHSDIDLIKLNCIAYNQDTSAIVGKASKVVEILHKIVQNPVEFSFNSSSSASNFNSNSRGSIADFDFDDEVDLGFDTSADPNQDAMNMDSSKNQNSSSSSSKTNNFLHSSPILRLPTSLLSFQKFKQKGGEISKEEEEDDEDEEEDEDDEENSSDGDQGRRSRRSSSRAVGSSSTTSSTSGLRSIRLVAAASRVHEKKNLHENSSSASTRLGRGRKSTKFKYSEEDNEEEDDDDEDEEEDVKHRGNNYRRNSNRNSTSKSNIRSGSKRNRYKEDSDASRSSRSGNDASDASDASGHRSRQKAATDTRTVAGRTGRGGGEARRGGGKVDDSEADMKNSAGGGNKRGRKSGGGGRDAFEQKNGNSNNNDIDESRIENMMVPILDRIEELNWIDRGGNRRDLKKILVKLQNYNHAVPFLEPVNLDEAPGYLDFVDEPMDISTLDAQVKNGQYDDNMLDFARDALKISDNCMKYNDPESDISIWALDLAMYVQTLIIALIDETSTSTAGVQTISTSSSSSNPSSVGKLVKYAYVVGEKVESQWADDKNWYAATVIQVTSIGTIRLRWEDGSESIATAPNTIRKLKDSDKKSANQNQLPSSSSTGRIDPELKKKMLNLLEKLEEADTNEFFKYPVSDEEVQGYSQVIQEPMDLQTIRRKYVRAQYKDMAAIISDVVLMLDNCELFNLPKSSIFKESKKLRKVASSFFD